MQCVIFDIDGTLVRSYNFDGECYRRAVRDTIGDVSFRSDWGEYPQVTDEGILQEVYSDNALKFTGSGEVRAKFGQFVVEHLSCEPSSCVEVPGARVLMKLLQKDPNLHVGIATGGWRHTASAKLDHVKIEYEDLPFFSSDDGINRIDIMELCRESMGCSPSETIYVGDGKWDMHATKTLGWRFIGIGPRLKGKCSAWVADFESCDFDAFIKCTKRGYLSRVRTH